VTAVLAVDVGGSKLAAGLVDPGGGLLRSDRVPTPRTDDAEALWEALAGLVGRVAGGATVAGVGVGSVGPMVWPEGVVSPLNVPAWRGFPLRTRLGERFPGVPVRVHNDAVCVAVGEHWRGAGRGHADVLGMVVSTGVGGGLVLGGRLVGGGTGNAGHVGHVVVEPGGPECGCGARGCLEAVASGPALVRWALVHGWTPSPPSGGAEPAGQPDARALAAAALAGDPVARAAFDRAGALLGLGIASAVALLDVDVVAVGGGLAHAGPLLFDPLRRAYARHARVAFARRTRVVPARLGTDAGLVGAAALVLRPDRYWPGG
jgi:glucokinase